MLAGCMQKERPVHNEDLVIIREINIKELLYETKIMVKSWHKRSFCAHIIGRENPDYLIGRSAQISILIGQLERLHIFAESAQ